MAKERPKQNQHSSFKLQKVGLKGTEANLQFLPNLLILHCLQGRKLVHSRINNWKKKKEIEEGVLWKGDAREGIVPLKHHFPVYSLDKKPVNL